MTEEQIELARRLMAHPQWMAEIGEALSAGRDWYGVRWVDTSLSTVPDLTDAATGGVLLEMVGNLIGGDVNVRYGHRGAKYPGRWYRLDLAGFLAPGPCPALAEACARALLALWGDE